MNGIEIVSTGYAKIEKTLDNQQLEQMVETSNEKDIFQINQVPF